MPSFWIVGSMLAAGLFAGVRRADSQTDAAGDQGLPSYRLGVSVDEVSLTFHAADAHDLPVNDLKVDDLSILDNGKPPQKVLVFRAEQNVPIRAGILIDTSESMDTYLARNRDISIEYAQRLLRQKSDQAFIMDFGYSAGIAQPWSGDPAVLIAGIRSVAAGRENPQGGTAIFNAIYRACLSEFGKIDHTASGNFILLFSDGEDNAGLTTLSQAVDACQQTNTAIYAFRVKPKSAFSDGPKTLEELAAETGGRVFADDDTDAGIYDDLRTIEGELRNQYRLIYKPAELKHNGAFHRIVLRGPERVASISVRSGYYAPAR